MSRQAVDQIPPTISIPVKEDSHSSREEGDFNPWTFVWILFGFKAVALGAIIYFAAGSDADTAILTSTHWFWLVIPAVALSGRSAYQWRLRRVRRRRAQLQASEWMVDELRSDSGRVRIFKSTDV